MPLTRTKTELHWGRTRQKTSTLVGQIRARDGDLCHWCKKPMNFDQAFGSGAWSVTIEHMVKAEHGGRRSVKNCTLAHKRCNNERHQNERGC